MNAFGKCSGGGRRSAPRELTPLFAIFTTVARSDRALVVDISATGARLHGDYLPSCGEALDLCVEKIRAFGTVMWARGRECGIEFDEPLNASEVTILRQRVTAQGGLSPQLKGALEDWMTGFAR